MKTRKLTIYTKFRIRRYDTTSLPSILLEGKWLKRLGFNEGQKVNIVQKRHKLIITIDKEQDEQHAAPAGN